MSITQPAYSYGAQPVMAQQTLVITTCSPFYQINFESMEVGKRIMSSKRRIVWRFGFTNMEALEAGGTGNDCRGEEHEITLIWSVTSGKRTILANGSEIHYSLRHSDKFEHTWTIRKTYVVKLVANEAPLTQNRNGHRQYDLLVNGKSFFTMPKVHELGLRIAGNVPVQVGAAAMPMQPPYQPGASGARYRNYDAYSREKESDMEDAIRASMGQARNHPYRTL